jgi:ubiquinone/menaquinone biosynthesis C-methylase UbiE
MEIARNNISDQNYSWWLDRVTSEIYLNTNRHDWWRACKIISEELKGCHSLIDIGTGDGHTLWQILSVALKDGTKINKVVSVEISSKGIELAKKRLEDLGLGSVSYFNGSFEDFISEEKYDVLYAGHVNYYLGKNYEEYENMIKKMCRVGKKVILMTAPKTSDYYKVVENPFQPFVTTEETCKILDRLGVKYKVIDTPIRFFVNHAFMSKHEMVLLWKFFKNTMLDPSDFDLCLFESRLKEVVDENGFINFQDQLIIIES